MTSSGGGHVGFTAFEILGRAVGKRTADGRDDDITLLERRAVRILHDADGLVAENEMVVARGKATVMPGDDFVVRPVDADPKRPHQNLVRVGFRSGCFDYFRRACPAPECDCMHTAPYPLGIQNIYSLPSKKFRCSWTAASVRFRPHRT